MCDAQRTRGFSSLTHSSSHLTRSRFTVRVSNFPRAFGANPVIDILSLDGEAFRGCARRCWRAGRYLYYFATGSSRSFTNFRAPTTATTSFTATDVAAAFGHEKVDGRYFIRVQGQHVDTKLVTLFYQDVKFPREGVYRLSFYSHCRLNAGTVANTCPTKWWLAKGGVTNQLIRTANDTRGYAEHTVDFYVPSADT